MSKSIAEKVTKQEALDKAMVLINSFVEIAKNGEVATVSIGTFKDIAIMNQVAAREG